MSVSDVKEMFKVWTNYSVHLMNGEYVKELGKTKCYQVQIQGRRLA